MAMEQRTRRRPLTRQEQLVLQERKQLRREKMEQSRELAKGPIDLPFCLLVLLLTAIGLVILLSASFPSAYYEANPSKHNPMYYFERQAVFAVLGTTVMFMSAASTISACGARGRSCCIFPFSCWSSCLFRSSASSATAPAAGSVWAC